MVALKRIKESRVGNEDCQWLRLRRLLSLSLDPDWGSPPIRVSMISATRQKAPIPIKLRTNSIVLASTVDSSTVENSSYHKRGQYATLSNDCQFGVALAK